MSALICKKTSNSLYKPTNLNKVKISQYGFFIMYLFTIKSLSLLYLNFKTLTSISLK